jgi:hypothetical protein
VRSTLLLAFLLALPGGAVGQLPGWLRPGARLRVTPRDASAPLVGVYVGSSTGSFTIVPDHGSDTVRVSLGLSGTIEVSRERRSYGGRGARIGAVVGSGMVLVVIASSDDEVPPSGLGTLVLCGIFGGMGAGLGGLIGSGFGRDTWEPIGPESARLLIAPASHGMSIGVSLKL